MKVRLFGVALVLVCLATFELRTGQSLTHSAVPVTGLNQKASVLEAYGKLPRIFEINQGQTDKQVKFLSRGSGYTLFLAQREAVLAMRMPAQIRSDRNPSMHSHAQASLHMKLVGGNPAAQIQGLQEQPGKINYFV